jgi:hypothetical protein
MPPAPRKVSSSGRRYERIAAKRREHYAETMPGNLDRFRKADLAAFRAMIKRYAANLAQEHPPALAAPEPATA